MKESFLEIICSFNVQDIFQITHDVYDHKTITSSLPYYRYLFVVPGSFIEKKSAIVL